MKDYKRFIGKIVKVEWLDHFEFHLDVDNESEAGPIVITTVGWLESIGKDFLTIVFDKDESKKGFHGVYLISNCIKSLELVTEKR